MASMSGTWLELISLLANGPWLIIIRTFSNHYESILTHDLSIVAKKNDYASSRICCHDQREKR